MRSRTTDDRHETTARNGTRRDMRRRPRGATAAGAAALALAGSLIGATPAQAVPGDTYLTAAEIADNLNSLAWPGQSAYNTYATGDQTTSVVWGTPGSATTYFNRSKCAGFVTGVLRQAWPFVTDRYLAGAFGSVSPTAAQYHDAFTAGVEHFTTSADADLDQVNELGAGVVIAIRYGGSPTATGDPTGHAMIVADAPVPYDRDGDASTVEWAVPVVDVTSNPHGVASTSPSSPYRNFRDTRAVGTTEYPGLGRGWIFIRTDAANRPLGHWWGANENVTTGYHPMADRPIAFGRAVGS
ncbi:hypothetical protein F4562_006548 [Streptosporangium becharense]|uniref:Uncharacterized protein n=1 Tax=Streptosporangium becharense TaxID=1816182 RepID=A0A7W9IMU2_9ACTN|nr:hypothetical protein [Streptosporangium becharense]MBB5823486.1 hypothetical protein [Streptosporangium becharense]